MNILQEDHDDYSVQIQDAPQFTVESQDKFFRAVVKFLLEGSDAMEARMLLTSEFSISKSYNLEEYIGGLPVFTPYISIACQRDNLEVLSPLNNPRSAQNESTRKIHSAFKSVMEYTRRIDYTVQYNPVNKTDMLIGWRETYYELAIYDGVNAHNQCLGAENAPNSTVWENLRFRSKTEVRVATALDRCAVMFFPLCSARVGSEGSRVRREPDFLVCHDGKWGILEVDGPHHTGRAADDHERDRLFRNHGLKVVEHYNADECFENADRVVNNFLNILDRNG